MYLFLQVNHITSQSGPLMLEQIMEPTTGDDNKKFDRGCRRIVSNNSRFGDDFFVDDRDIKWLVAVTQNKNKKFALQVARESREKIVRLKSW